MPPALTPPDRPAWSELQLHFERLLPLGAGPRTAALAEMAAEQPALVAELQALLAQHDAEEAAGGRFLASPPPLALPVAATNRQGERLGPWLLRELLGEGGMGQVWRAERADGTYEAEVAVKLLHTGPASGAWAERFLDERRQLARLTHPHIARLLDAGQAPDGTPYLVMEAVAGQPIDRACRGLALSARLGLFLQLCDAVAHAHRQLLVHRDLKPSNVLVTAEGEVKLLDFGIAEPPHAQHPGDAASGDTALPRLGPMTPLCASPEQLRGEAVGTASDVYALGVLLHQLLTGTRPYGRNATTAAQALQAALHEAPVAPSAAPAPADAADGLPPALLRGDLDAIVARALARPVEARYPSVEALAADLRAHLAHRCISARPATWRLRTGRWLRRNRAVAGVAGASLTALLALVVGLAWQVRQTEQARLQAEANLAEVRQLANGLVFRYHDRIVNLAGALPARQALLTDAVGYLDRLAAGAVAETPQGRALARELSGTYQRIAVLYGETFSPNLGKLPDAMAAAEKGLALLPRFIDAADTPLSSLNEAADLWQVRAQLDSRRGDLPATLAALQAAQAVAERARARAPEDLQVRSRLATLAGRQAQVLGGSSAAANLGRVAEACERWATAVAQLEALQREEPANPEWQHQLGWALNAQANCLLLDGRAAEALPPAQRAVALRDAAATARPDDQHWRYQQAITRLNLSTVLGGNGRHTDALATQAEARARIAAAAQADPGNRNAERDLRLADLALARLLVGAERPAEAQPLLQATLDGLPPAAALQGDFFLRRWRAEALVWMARVRLQPAPAEALALAQEAAVLMAAPASGDDGNAARRWLLAQALGEQAQALQALQRPAEAAALARQAVQAWGGAVPGSLQPRAARDRSLAGAAGPA